MNTALSVYDINWDKWVPQERSVLCFISVADQLLLINKKTGLGIGMVNAPGGRIEENETEENAAIRETFEEIGVIPQNLKRVCELYFAFTNGYSLHGAVFFADNFTGTPVETIEAKPFWCPINSIPYDQMWQDDKYWLPLVLEGKTVKGYFIFDDYKMISQKILIV